MQAKSIETISDVYYIMYIFMHICDINNFQMIYNELHEC